MNKKLVKAWDCSIVSIGICLFALLLVVAIRNICPRITEISLCVWVEGVFIVSLAIGFGMAFIVAVKRLLEGK